MAVLRLVAELKKREPTLREAAIRRLHPHARIAAGSVTEAFVQGTLQTRLAALELLAEWKAPVQDLDPWRPETFTAARLKSLKAWAIDPGATAVGPAQQLTPVQLAAARREIARLGQGSDADAVAIRERLARHGAALLPEVYARLKQAETDRDRERLTALRYRLVAGDRLALAWPGGMERLAATTAAVRRQAVQELAERATVAEEPLLLELFSNPDPLVREISLHVLHESSGHKATVALTRLLRDPDLNVRAAVLKQLAERPSASVVPKIAEYVAAEKDPDLVVHAIRVLRETEGKAALDALTQVLGHDSWRVRAEAAEALGECAKRGHLGTEVVADAYTALIQLLKDSDGFVVARAVSALGKADFVATVEPLVQAAEKHPGAGAQGDHGPDLWHELASPSDPSSAQVLLARRSGCARPR